MGFRDVARRNVRPIAAGLDSPFATVEVGEAQPLFDSKRVFPGEFRLHPAFVGTDNEFDTIRYRLHERDIEYFTAPIG